MSDPSPVAPEPPRPTPLVLPRPADARPWAPLPAPPTDLVGRGAELAALLGLLADPAVRLLTLTGPGSTGKTRLALAAAHARERAGAEVAFVALAPVADPALVAPTVARALSVRETPDRPAVEALTAALRAHELLLLLDNFEHLLPAAPLASELVAACPGLTLLVTSRAPLRLVAERVVPVPPLALPDPAAPPDPARPAAAVRLFAERARAVAPGFALTAENAAAVAEVCRRLGGLPLAIELAAGRSRALDPAALLARPEPRLPLLTGGPRDAPARLRTMRAAIAWRYDLLAPPDQTLFRRLAVFVGGCTLDAAEAVASREVEESGSRDGGAPSLDSPTPRLLDSMEALLDHGLLRREDAAGEPRFGMLEPVREFGLELLSDRGEDAAARDAHAAHFVALGERVNPLLFRGDQARWLDRLESELGNLRAVLDWSLPRGDAATAHRLLAGTLTFWVRRSYLREGLGWADRALALADPAPPAARVTVLYGAGIMAAFLGDLDRALALCREAVALARETGDRPGLGHALLMHGSALHFQGDLDAAEAAWEESAAILRGLDDVLATNALASLGWIAGQRGDRSRRAALVAEQVALAERFDDVRSLATARCSQAEVAFDAGDHGAAVAAAQRALAGNREIGSPDGIAYTLSILAIVAEARGDLPVAARWFGADAALRAATGVADYPETDPRYVQTVARLKERLEEPSFVAAWDAGRAAPLAEVLAEAEAYRVPETVAAPPVEPGAPPDPFGLTPRERDVLRLVVAGHTDRQIADDLFLSRRTASKHVENILAKLGVPTRSAAASAAVRLGLV